MIATREEIRAAAGHLIICGFDGTQVTAELKEILREVKPAGVILFARNVESPPQVAELCRELKSLRPRDPLLVGIDQEGGRVARLRAPATEWPPMRALGQLGDADLVRQVGAALAAELRAMNIDIDFAPVLDVDTNPDNPVIGDRSFSDDPDRVAQMGVALLEGLQQNGVAACGKHFPGHGDTHLDSHLELPTVSHDLDRLRAIEWIPFRRAIEAGIGAIMTAHVVVEALDTEHPATLSSKALAPLRRELGFKGVIVSDDLEMKAVADHYRPEQMAQLGLGAGVDVFLACHQPEVILDLYRGIVVAVEQELVSHDRLLEAETRLVAWRRRYWAPPVTPAEMHVVGCAEHQLLVQQVSERMA